MALKSARPQTHLARIAAIGVLSVAAACGDEGPMDSSLIPELPMFTQIAAGARHTCALAADGQAWCWGLGDDGQIGPARSVPPFVPAPVSATLRFVGIAAGSRHSCGLTETGAVYCWGLGPWGGGPVPSLIEGSGGLIDITSMHGHVCSTTTDREIACFGDAARGQLGPGVPPSNESSAVPARVPGLSNIQGVTAGKNHTCALDGLGAAWCWGLDEAGQIGAGGSPSTCPIGFGGLNAPCALDPVLSLSGGPYTDLVAGLFHNCGLLEAGAVECWGDDAIGQLGVDRGGSESCNWVVDSPGETRPCGLAPGRVAGTTSFESLASGQLHTCGIAAGGEGYCWGASNFGQLGSTAQQPGGGPELIAGGHAWVMLAGGLAHTCGITAEGAAYCWGDGSLGQLGSSSDLAPEPLLVDGR